MRNLTSAHKAKLAAKVKYVGVIVEIDYTPTPLRVWTGLGEISWDGKTWAGIGQLGGISAITEKVGIRAGQVTLTLGGIPAEHKTIALNDTSQNRSVRIWLATFNVSEGVWTVVDDPGLLERGETDVHEIVEEGAEKDTCTIQVTVETPLSRLTIISVLRQTHEDQQLDFPGDRGFEYAAAVAEQVLYWPTPEPQQTNSPAATTSARSGRNTVHNFV